MSSSQESSLPFAASNAVKSSSPRAASSPPSQRRLRAGFRRLPSALNVFTRTPSVAPAVAPVVFDRCVRHSEVEGPHLRDDASVLLRRRSRSVVIKLLFAVFRPLLALSSARLPSRRLSSRIVFVSLLGVDPVEGSSRLRDDASLLLRQRIRCSASRLLHPVGFLYQTHGACLFSYVGICSSVIAAVDRCSLAVSFAAGYPNCEFSELNQKTLKSLIRPKCYPKFAILL